MCDSFQLNLECTLLLFLVWICTSCVERFNFDSITYEKALVVDGLLTNESGMQSVSLSYAYSLDTFAAETISDAAVWVTDGAGNRTDFECTDAGIYSGPEGFIGTDGETYQLHILLSDGSAYSSSEQTLISSPPIDSLYGIYALDESEDKESYVGGIKFVVDTHDPTGRAHYFRYEYSDAYKIQTPYPTYFDGLVQTTVLQGVCYSEDFSDHLIYASTVESSVDELREFPVCWVSEESQALRIRFTLEVYQYVISEEAYTYYKALDETNTSSGTLFDKQLGSVFGNIHSETNEEEEVLGFFEVSGVYHERKWFNNEDLDDRLNVQFPYSCSPSYMVEAKGINEYIKYRGLGYAVYTYDGETANMIYIECIKCSFYADIDPPDYWVNE